MNVVIHTDLQLEIGKTYHGDVGEILGPDGLYHRVSFRVVRGASFTEYVEAIGHLGITFDPEYVVHSMFYLIETD